MRVDSAGRERRPAVRVQRRPHELCKLLMRSSMLLWLEPLELHHAHTETYADVVVPDVATADIIIGRDFLRKHESSVAFGEDSTASLKLGGGRTCVQLGCPELVKRDESCVVDWTTKEENCATTAAATGRPPEWSGWINPRRMRERGLRLQ